MIIEPIYIGSVGLVCILIAFFWDEFYEATDTYEYNLLNLVGAAALAYYSYSLKSMPFIILQVVWGVVALAKMVKLSERKKRK
ncbi:MAG: hypothetical protein Q7R76_04665 [Candidatus Woesearchaeota archaeon]|nr:hypothetical protein [Candidatus Woesearchaeota archaeon]